VSSVSNIVIVGGGTAGWLSALLISRYVGSQAPVSIKLVESSSVPSIGVGEGTTAVFGSLLQQLGIDETEFLAATGATIKYGIQHRDWRRLNHSYNGPIDDPHQVTDLTGNVRWLDVAAIASGQSSAQHHLFHYLLTLNKAPVATVHGRTIPVGPYQHAYHFDQARVGQFLKSKASVEHLDATVTTVNRDAYGCITSLTAEDGRRISGDFFIDCTGLHRQLIGEHPDFTWTDYRDQLPVNRAMPFWLPHKKNEEIPPFTSAWAQRCGWMWRIPTQERLGCGYVYSDAHCTPEQAQQEIETALGRAIEPRADLKFCSGRLQQCWLGNCIALGLSQSFLEPLEATSIHATIVQLMLLLQQHTIIKDDGVEFQQANDYNDVVAMQLDSFRDFINIHYVSERRDSPFWEDVDKQCISDYNRTRIKQWATSMPKKNEFSPMPNDLPHIEDQLYYPVLEGLGLLNQNAAKALLKENPVMRKKARANVKALCAEFRQAATKAMNHNTYLKV